MRVRFTPWLKAAGAAVFMTSLLSLGTGCGALKAAANPKSAWAIGDPAPMAVVVRRADAAEGTSKEVDRLLTSTPAGADSPWVQATAPTADEQKKDGDALSNHSLYTSSQARILAAELWAKELPTRKDDSAPKPAATPADAKKENAAAPAKGAPSKIAKAAKPGKTGKKRGTKGAAATAAAAVPAPDATAKAEPVGTTTLTSAEVPAKPAGPRAASLIAAIDPALAEQYAQVMAKKKEIADLKAQIALEEQAEDEKGISDADKKAHKDKADALDKQVGPAEDAAEKLAKEFVPAAKAASQKASADVKDKFGPALVALRQAVADADLANSAAAVKYPLAVPTVKDSATSMIGVYVADVIEEKTGKRPDLRTLKPGLTLDGTKVQITLNGLTPEDMGKLSMGEVTSEVLDREQKWVKHAVALMATIASTKEILSFEEEVLAAFVDGMQADGWKAPAPPVLTEPKPAKPAGAAAAPASAKK